MRTRNGEQRTRAFLSSALKNDVCEPPAAATPDGTSSLTFSVSIDRLTGTLADEAEALRVTLFDHAKQRFIGKTFTAKLCGAGATGQLAPFMFHTPTTAMYLVVEATRRHFGQDRVMGWSYMSVDELDQRAALTFQRGSGQLLQLYHDKWKELCDSVGTAELKATKLGARTRLTQLLPRGVFVPHGFADVWNDAEMTPMRPFRVCLDDFAISPRSSCEAEGRAMFTVGTQSWSILAAGHNGRRFFAVSEECDLVLPNEGRLVSVEGRSLELRGLPVHRDTSVILCVRRQLGPASPRQVVGFAVLPLCPEGPPRDADVVARALPLLTGPFACEDARLTCLNPPPQRYQRLPLDLAVRASLHDTPTPAPRVPRKVPRPAAQPTRPEAPAPRAAEPPAAAAPTAAESARATPIAEPLPRAPRAAQPQERGTDSEIHSILLAVVDEMQQLRAVVDSHFAAAGPSGDQPDEQARALGVQPTGIAGSADATARDAAARVSAEAQQRDFGQGADAPELVDILPRRVQIRHGTRLKLADGLTPLMHPERGTRLVSGEASSQPLPLPQLGMRFEGLTVCRGYGAPARVVARACIATAEEVSMGPMTLSKCDEDRVVGTTFAIGTPRERGFAWIESVSQQDLNQLSPEAAERWRRLRREGSIYLHLYDARSDIYFGTAVIPLQAFHRPSTVAAVAVAHDAPLFWDHSMGDAVGGARAPIFPFLATAGYIHLTLLNIGRSSQALLMRSNGEKVAKKVGGGTAVVAARIPVEFGDAAAAPAAALPAAAATTPPPAAAGMTGLQRNLHLQRAGFVKSLLADENARKRLFGAQSVGAAELEFKLKFAERRRDEIKASKIAAVLRERITEQHHVCTSRGCPETVKVLFANPFPQSIQFHIEVTAASCQWLQIHGSCPTTLMLGPKEDVMIPAVVRVDDSLAASQVTASFAVRTEKGETVRIVNVVVELVPTVVQRRYHIFGEGGSEVVRSIYSRALSTTDIVDLARGSEDGGSGSSGADREPSLERMFDRLGRLCRYARVTDPALRVTVDAKIDPLTATKAVAWETVEVTAAIPQRGATNGGATAKEVLLFLYKDAACTQLWETWALALCPTPAVDTATIVYGGASTVMLRVDEEVDAAFVASESVAVLSPGSGGDGPTREIALRAFPKQPGSFTVLVRTMRGGERRGAVLCNFTCVAPRQSIQSEFFFPVTEAAHPIMKCFHFTNEDRYAKLFKINHNYAAHLDVNPRMFSLGPQGVQKVGLRLHSLTPGRYPMWIFVNDANDATIEAYCMNVVVGGAQPIG